MENKHILQSKKNGNVRRITGSCSRRSGYTWLRRRWTHSDSAPACNLLSSVVLVGVSRKSRQSSFGQTCSWERLESFNSLCRSSWPFPMSHLNSKKSSVLKITRNLDSALGIYDPFLGCYIKTHRSSLHFIWISQPCVLMSHDVLLTCKIPLQYVTQTSQRVTERIIRYWKSPLSKLWPLS